jgi:hypothetical protein
MKFRKIVCGTDFSLAMVIGSSQDKEGRLYGWGNKDYLLRTKGMDDQNLLFPEAIP